MNRVLPEYARYDQNLDSIVEYSEDRKLRLQVTRYTDYGERYKMFAFPIEANTKASVLEIFARLATRWREMLQFSGTRDPPEADRRS